MSDHQATVRTAGPGPGLDTTRGAAVPYVTYGLIAVNLAVFVACLAQAGGTDFTRSAIMRHGALITGLGYEQEYWRLLTSGFLHWSVMHVAVNMISLFIVGRDLERLFGPARYAAIYLIGLLGGSAAVMAIERDPTVTAGASGAIYGLMGALLVVVLKLKLPPTSVLVVIGFNVVLSLSIPGISLLGHLGGLVFGALAAGAVVWLPNKVLPPQRRTAPAVSRVGWYGLVGLVVLTLALGTGFATFA